MNSEHDELMKLADAFAARLYAAIPPGDIDCEQAFKKWRSIQQELFATPNPSREVMFAEKSAFDVLIASLAFGGVEVA